MACRDKNLMKISNTVSRVPGKRADFRVMEIMKDFKDVNVEI